MKCVCFMPRALACWFMSAANADSLPATASASATVASKVRIEMGHPFLDLPNGIGSPHNSAGSRGTRMQALRAAVANCRRALAGEAPEHLVRADERLG